MPRLSPELSALVTDLHNQIARAIESARQAGRAEALGEIQSLVGNGDAVKRGPGRPRGSTSPSPSAAAALPGKRRKSSWAGLSPAARLARVNAIRKGKGLPPRSE
jgi:hypothetical protein